VTEDDERARSLLGDVHADAIRLDHTMLWRHRPILLGPRRYPPQAAHTSTPRAGGRPANYGDGRSAVRLPCEPGGITVPLSGIRVVDLTRILAGPFCSMLLADMGADVVKIEPPGDGDPIRGVGVVVQGLSWYFAQFNRNKRSLTLDLRTEDGKAILAR